MMTTFQKLKSGAVFSRLTKDQLCLFDMITTSIEKKQRPPTLKEIQWYFGVGSVIVVPQMLEPLVKRKLITRNETRRGIKATKVPNDKTQET